jgi:hypothetical protein
MRALIVVPARAPGFVPPHNNELRRTLPKNIRQIRSVASEAAAS